MIIKRVGPVSCARMSAVLYAIMGVIIGVFFSLAALAGAFANQPEGPGNFPAIFGAAAVVILPILYGCLGFVGTLIFAWLYNMLAGWLGGVEVDIQ